MKRIALWSAVCLLSARHLAAADNVVSYVISDSGDPSAPLVREAVEAGRKRIEDWFGRPFPKPFSVQVLPGRADFDATFQKRWGVPKTECWMVGAGVADSLYLLSPSRWKIEGCDHSGSPAEVREIVAHELVHVFHGQYAPSPEFDGMDDLGWFVEGLATLVSGQVDDERAGDASKALAEGKGPASLATAWSGRWRYGVAGSLARYVQARYGKETVDRLLRVGTNEAALKLLGTTEPAFLAAWREWVAKGSPVPVPGAPAP